MAPLGPVYTPNLAVTTIVCGWIFTAVATLAMLLLLWARRLLGMGLLLDDYMTCLVFVLAIGLVSHTTWAVVDEGLGKQLEDVPINSRQEIIRVRSLRDVVAARPNPSGSSFMFVVSYRQRNFVDAHQRSASIHRIVFPSGNRRSGEMGQKSRYRVDDLLRPLRLCSTACDFSDLPSRKSRVEHKYRRQLR